METLRSLLFQSAPQSRGSRSIYKRGAGMGGTLSLDGHEEEEEEEEGGAEMKMVEAEPDNDPEVPSLTRDITSLVLRRPPDHRRALLYLVLTALIIFIAAFLLGYLAFRRSCYSCSEGGAEFVSVDDPPSSDSTPQGGVLYWAGLRDMLQKYLGDESIEKTVRRFSQSPHPPGSAEGKTLAAEVLDTFKKLNLDHTWTDSHYARLQFPDRMKPNSLHVVDSADRTVGVVALESSAVYCAYSATGNTTGSLVYVNYGRREDFEVLEKLGVQVKNNIVITRVGKISFAEKVANAEQFEAGGVLLYPDPADIPQDPRGLGLYSYTAISEHVHLGSGDPYTPGFPSFNHTQFPPIQSSGLPSILAHPISANVASKLLSQLSGPDPPKSWRGRLPYVTYRLGPSLTSADQRRFRLGVNNYMSSVLINNIFGSVEGKEEPDQYIILGAQRDSWGPGAAKSGVGTAILLELARTFRAMVQNGFQPRRSLLFVSWDAGDFGSVGATEWLEGYLTMLHLKAVAYFSLDRAVLGDDRFVAYTSPLLANLIEGVIKQVDSPKHPGQTIHSQLLRQGRHWKSEV